MDIKFIARQENYAPFLELFPPQPSNKILPEWYKKLNRTFKMDTNLEGKTIKSCPAVQDILTAGFVIPLWSKFEFASVKDDNNFVVSQHWRFHAATATNEELKYHLGSHSQEQIGDMGIKTTLDGAVLKLPLPYTIKVPKGYNIMYSDPFYHFRKDIRCLPGIVEADKWGQITFPFEALKSNFIIEAGTPLVHCLVYKREKEAINIITEKGTHEDYYQSYKETFELFSTEKNYRTK